MGGVGRALFGGSKQSSKPIDVTPGEVGELRRAFAEALPRFFPTGAGADIFGNIPGAADVTNFTGLASPPTEGELATLERLAGFIQGGSPGPDPGLVATARGGQTNPFLQAAIEAAQRPTLQALEETLTRTLPGRFTVAGHTVAPGGSSAFDRAAAIATRGAADALSEIATNLSSQSFEAERGRQQEAQLALTEQALTVDRQQVQNAVDVLQAQALPRLIKDLGIDRGLQEFQVRMQAVLQALGIATGTPLQTVGTKARGTSQRGLSQGFSDVAGGIADLRG